MSALLAPDLQAALHSRAAEALAHWGGSGQAPRLLKYRENAVFQVELEGEPAALRLHRPGYHDAASLRSELAWMAHLRLNGLAVPRPIPARAGSLLVHLAGDADFGEQHADVMSWVSGVPLGESGVPLSLKGGRLASIFFAIGAAMAQMHSLSEDWTLPNGFKRPAWDFDGLLGETPLWGRFWDCSGLPAAQREELTKLRLHLQRELQSRAGVLDYGLIHADLVRENVFVSGEEIAFLDFDDSGFGWRMFDVATALIKNRSEPEYDSIQRSLIAGYRSERVLTDEALAMLPLFTMLRHLTYIGWFAERPELPGATLRITRFADESLAMAADFGFTS